MRSSSWTRGRIIAQGPPRRLLHEHFAEVLLELPRQEFPAAARALPLNIIDARRSRGDQHPRPGSHAAHPAGGESALTNLRIRPANLEDLFLELTGTELRP